jgi:hypothetical protein
MLKRSLLVSFVVLAGCGGKVDETDAEACEHIVEAGKALTATATPAGAPVLSDDHERNDLALIDVSGGKGGYAAFTVTENGDYLFYLDTDVTLEVLNSAGVPVTFEKTEKAISACKEVKAKYTVGLMLGTYSLRFGPTSETKVGLIVEHGEHAEE